MKPLLPIIVALLAILINGCVPISAIFLGNPDHKDINRFESRAVTSDTSCFEFNRSGEDLGTSIGISDWAEDIPFYMPLAEFTRQHDPRSMLVIQNDSIKFEFYGKGLAATDLHSSYSIAKSFVSVLIGIAIDEGFIENEQELVTKFIPELKGTTHAESLNIEHLLNHTSGIHYSLSLDGTIYYGADILGALDMITFDSPPGTKQHYLNINAQLLGIVLKRATGMPPANYLEQKIWKPIQMCSDAIWSIDKKNALEKTFCCLGATALDYARFGRLMLNKGTWNGRQIFSESWYNRSIHRDASNGSSLNYNYSWHIGLKEYGDFMAIGLYKQHIYVNPDKNLIIVVLNDRENRLEAERLNWWYIFRQIADQM